MTWNNFPFLKEVDKSHMNFNYNMETVPNTFGLII